MKAVAYRIQKADYKGSAYEELMTTLQTGGNKKIDAVVLSNNYTQYFHDAGLIANVDTAKIPNYESVDPVYKDISPYAVDAEGKRNGIEEELAEMLGDWAFRSSGFPITYAGGVGSFGDLEKLKTLGRGLLDVTIGSALDIFGGEMKLTEVVEYLKKDESF